MPPSYDLSMIKHSVTLLFGDKDYFLNDKAMEMLKEKMVNSKNVKMLKYEGWAHYTYSIGKNLVRIVDDLEDQLKKRSEIKNLGYEENPFLGENQNRNQL